MASIDVFLPSRTAWICASSTPSARMLCDRRVDVGVGRRDVGLRLLQLTARERVVLEQRRIAIGDALRVAECRLCLAIRRRPRSRSRATTRRRAAGRACTTAPGFTTTRVAGPETGDSTCVELSPLNATLPVASTIGRNATGCTVTRWMRCRCSGGERDVAAACGAADVSPSWRLGAVVEEHAAAIDGEQARRTRVRGESSVHRLLAPVAGAGAERAIEIGAGRVGRGECVGELASAPRAARFAR